MALCYLAPPPVPLYRGAQAGKETPTRGNAFARTREAPTRGNGEGSLTVRAKPAQRDVDNLQGKKIMTQIWFDMLPCNRGNRAIYFHASYLPCMYVIRPSQDLCSSN
jgi:hypothetical protein